VPRGFCHNRSAARLGYGSEFERAVVPARVKLNLTSMIRCFSESVGANVHFFDAWMASRSN
jgi:hypothetical protein